METIWKYSFSNIVAFALWIFYFWMSYVEYNLVFRDATGKKKTASSPQVQMILVAHSSIHLSHQPANWDLAKFQLLKHHHAWLRGNKAMQDIVLPFRPVKA